MVFIFNPRYKIYLYIFHTYVVFKACIFTVFTCKSKFVILGLFLRASILYYQAGNHPDLTSKFVFQIRCCLIIYELLFFNEKHAYINQAVKRID